MFVLSSLSVAVAQILDIALTILWWLILIRVLISWVNPDPYNPIVRFLYKTTEPVLYPIRRLLPVGLMLGIDISPIIAFLAIMFVKAFLVRILIDLAIRLR